MFSENGFVCSTTWLALNESFIAMFSSTCMSISSSEDGLINKMRQKLPSKIRSLLTVSNLLYFLPYVLLLVAALMNDLNRGCGLSTVL